MARRALFLDKDGTLLVDVPYNVDPQRMRLMSQAGAGLRRFRAEGYLLLVVSNQPGVAHGYFTEDQLVPVEKRLRELLADEGVPMAGFYYCSHHPQGAIPKYAIACKCRKPQPGLLQRAARQHDVDLSASWMIGDILDDVEAGHRAGCQTVLLLNGGETKWETSPLRTPGIVAADLEQSANLVLSSASASRLPEGPCPAVQLTTLGS